MKTKSEFNTMPVVGCMPNCAKGCRKCNFDQDYTKNYMDALEDRPGYFHEFNEELNEKKEDFKKSRGKGQKNVVIENTQ